MIKFDNWLFKYVLSAALTRTIKNISGIASVDFDSTTKPSDPAKFFANIPAKEAVKYDRFCEETARLSVVDAHNNEHRYYLFFRNGMSKNNGSFNYTRPSSVEIGSVVNGTYNFLSKTHYTAFFDPKVGFTDDADRKTKINQMVKSLIADITADLAAKI